MTLWPEMMAASPLWKELFSEPATFQGMVDTRVRQEDWECYPDRPNPASCPSSGCRHCRPISMAADPPGAMVDTEADYQLSLPFP